MNSLAVLRELPYIITVSTPGFGILSNSSLVPSLSKNVGAMLSKEYFLKISLMLSTRMGSFTTRPKDLKSARPDTQFLGEFFQLSALQDSSFFGRYLLTTSSSGERDS